MSRRRGSARGRRGWLALATLATALAAGAAPWPNGTPEMSVEPDSVVAIAGMPGTVGVWVRFTYPMSVDCSPPAGCYAKAMRVYYLMNCATGAMTLVQRMALDLNGDVAAQSGVEYGGPWVLPALGSCEYAALRYVCAYHAPRAAAPLD